MAKMDPQLERYFRKNWEQFRSRYNALILSTIATVVGITLTVSGIVLSVRSGSLEYDLLSIFGLLLTVLSGWSAYKQYRERSDLFREVLPPAGESFYSISFPATPRDLKEFHCHEWECEKDRITALKPEALEMKSGFQWRQPGLGSIESAFSSDDLNSRLMTDPVIVYKIDPKERLENEPTTDQFKFLVSKVLSNALTNDDSKLCISSDFLSDTSEVVLSKRSYFDGLVTNEAFRSRLYRRPAQANRAGELVSEFRQLKETPEFRAEPVLPSLGNSKASNHIGASVFCLSSDGFPIFFEQGMDQAEGAGSLVVAGTGSTDWDDILPPPMRMTS